MKLLLALAALAGVLVLLYLAPQLAYGLDDPEPPPPSEPELVDGKTAAEWRGRALDYRQRWKLEKRANNRHAAQVRRLRRALRHKPSSLEALRLAAIAYNVPFSTLYRKASCESTGRKPASPPSNRTLDPLADNPTSTASGLLQFLYHPSGRGSTWHTTPYAAESVWSPYANALAAGFMHANGRAGEWVCR